MKRLLFASLTILLIAATGTKAQTATWWGYWNQQMSMKESVACQTQVSHVGIQLTAANSQLSGSQLHGMRFYISDKTAVTKAWIWLTTNPFSGSPENADKYYKEVDVTLLRDVMHDGAPTVVTLDEPVALLGAGRYARIYAGYTLQVEGTAAPCHVMTAGAGTKVSANSCIMDWQQGEDNHGPVALQLLVSGEKIAQRGVAVSLFDDDILMVNETQTFDVQLTTDGIEPVSSFDYRLTAGDNILAEDHVTMDSPISELGISFNHPITFTLPSAAQQYTCRLQVTKVNGEPNLSSEATAQKQLTVLSQKPVKRAVMEEYTGTWCPNCPRGDVGMHLLDDLYGDRFIGIAVHNGDPMTIDDYDKSEVKKKFVDGYPSCVINRLIACDPYTGLNIYEKRFQSDQMVEYALNMPTVADIEVSGKWDENSNRLTCTAATTFRYSGDDAPYSIAFILTADSLTGEGKDWLQVNTFAGSTEWDEHMNVFTQAERNVKMAYNHVAIAVAGIEQGLSGSVETPFVCDETQHYTYHFDLTGNALVQDRSRVNIVALLIDTTTGQVTNAAKVRTTDASAITSVRNDSTHDTTHYYDMTGRRVCSPSRGTIIIQRMKDGSVRKMMR